MKPASMGWTTLFRSWKNKLPNNLKEVDKELINLLIEMIVIQVSSLLGLRPTRSHPRRIRT